MPQLRYFTAGESHGQCLIGILEGLPAGLKIDLAAINRDLARRQQGYGRGGRMKLEADQAEVLSGVRRDETIGSPVTVMIKNRDFKINELPAVTKPRPGHADLAGLIKYDREDARDILERSSARETTVRVAIGGVCKLLLAEVGVDIVGHIVSLGPVHAKTDGLTFAQIRERSEASEVRCADPDAEKKMIEAIDAAKGQGDTLGGVFEVIAVGLPIGLGSHVQWDRKLDANLARALMSIQAMKGVEVGLGFEAARRFGSQVHDEILPAQEGVLTRAGNNAGGLEGGMTNETLVYADETDALRRYSNRAGSESHGGTFRCLRHARRGRHRRSGGGLRAGKSVARQIRRRQRPRTEAERGQLPGRVQTLVATAPDLQGLPDLACWSNATCK